MKGLLKFITCGSVDDGKSTLIGHMLYDAKLLFTDQKRALELDSKVGSRGGAIDYSLLLDGLMAEREQGITIDVAYRYFTTDHRSFIVADTPGHEEYTRNMAVGASFAELAVILIDATKGVLIQTRRHARICSLMGIKHFVFAVNKMDLIDYDSSRFEKIKREIKMLLAEFDYESVKIIPVSATEGDNITKPSMHMGWYKEETLLSYLENVDIDSVDGEKGFTMPVQRVCRPNHTFRGFQGQIESGKIKIGDEVIALPSNERANVQEIINCGANVQAADKGRAVTIQLDREVDVSRGCVLASGCKPLVGNLFTVKLLWMDDTNLATGKNYLLKIGTKKVPAVVMNIKYKIDVNTGNEVSVDSIYKNEIAVCDISVSEKIVFDEFSNNLALGSFILVDRLSHMTSACGVVLHRLSRSDNLTWYTMDVTRKQRSNQKGQKAKTIWLTGLSGAGKSTIANEIEKRLFAVGKHTMTLDGDNVRLGLNKNLGFKEADRIENIRRIAEVAKLMNDAGLIVIASFVSPYERDRVNAKEIIGSDDFIEVYVSTSVEECERRDVKGLYKKARNGEIPNFTGISSAYEVPVNPNITIDTSELSIEEASDFVMNELRRYL
ncbi:adenylyl-sulfate kinase [Clostridium oryzae]|uniref:Adenylyl-sulfate kinase n=1 Tax=Clostridium oryzae TaxID=1450648 RepID=A0A1V4IN04_9CLOT|nr:adenylyl-sulfate kinase [Clostridium oryzae]OPJ61432.1 bifunctional enzyme CysN/CysC [Clostridium oryzae]